MRRLFLIAVWGMFSVVLVACGGESTPQPVSQQTTPTEEALVVNPSGEVVARVNGIEISKTLLESTLMQRQQGTSASDLDALAQQVLDSLIEQELVRQFAQKNGIIVTEQDAQNAVNALKQSVGTGESGESAWQAFLTMNGLTESEMLLAQQEALLNQQVREQLYAPLMGDVAQAHARHIVVENEGVALEVMNKLQGGANFIELAERYSLDLATRENGGDLGWFTADELIDDRLAQILFSLKVGEIAGPIRSRLGYHVVQLIETGNRPIEPERMTLLMERTYVKWLEAQYQTATIERFR